MIINYTLRSLKMQFRIPISVFFSLVFPIVMMSIMMISYGNFSIGGGLNFIDKYFLISISIGVIPITIIGFPIWFADNIENNYLLRLRYFNVDIRKVISGDLIAYLIISALSILLNIVIGKLFWNLQLPDFKYFFSFLIQCFFCILVLFIFGLLIAMIIPKSKVLMPLGMIIMFMLYMFIGVFVEFDKLPKSFKSVSNLLPLKYMTNDFFDIWSQKKILEIKFLQLNLFWLTIFLFLVILVYVMKYKNFREDK